MTKWKLICTWQILISELDAQEFGTQREMSKGLLEGEHCKDFFWITQHPLRWYCKQIDLQWIEPAIAARYCEDSSHLILWYYRYLSIFQIICVTSRLLSQHLRHSDLFWLRRKVRDKYSDSSDCQIWTSVDSVISRIWTLDPVKAGEIWTRDVSVSEPSLKHTVEVPGSEMCHFISASEF